MVPASFAGCGFYVSSGGFAGGRRLAVHEYPKQDVPFTEDLGRKARRWQITAYVVGPYYLADRDALIAACEAPGPATLVHPSLGSQQVHCESCSPVETWEKGGLCTFELIFAEAGQDPNASATTDTQAQVSSAANANGTTAAATGDKGVANSSSPSASSIGGIGSDTVAAAKASAGSTYPTSAPSNVGSFDRSTSTVG